LPVLTLRALSKTGYTGNTSLDYSAYSCSAVLRSYSI
jgi:hypothetical protein